MNEFIKHVLLAALLLTAATWTHASGAFGGEESGDDESPRPKRPSSNVNVRSPTLGGAQFWADELVFRGWRIQRNVFTNHYRLLDDWNVRHAWGSWEACEEKFNQIKRERDLPAIKGKVVVLVHGLARTRQFMRHVVRQFEADGEYTIINVEYPSTRAGIDGHAKGLARVIEHLPDAEHIDFVAHSLGCLVVRHYLADVTAEGKKLDPRIKRFVMLGPPNHGAALARFFEPIPIFHLAIRGTGRQLTEFDELSQHLGTPPCEFGILAGGTKSGRGFNPLLEGDDDLVVRLEETKLAGAADFRVLPLRHTVLARDKGSLDMVLTFLREGHFTTADERQPIPLEDDEPADAECPREETTP